MQYKSSFFITLLVYKVQNESDFSFLFMAVFLVPKTVSGTGKVLNQYLLN